MLLIDFHSPQQVGGCPVVWLLGVNTEKKNTTKGFPLVEKSEWVLTELELDFCQLLLFLHLSTRNSKDLDLNSTA